MWLRRYWELTGQHLLATLEQATEDMDDETAIRVLEELAALDEAEGGDSLGIESAPDPAKAVEAGISG